METPKLKLDPDGDVVLILENPNAQLLQWGDKDLEKTGRAVEGEAMRAPAVEELRMLVSSRHLCLASSTFKTMLGGPWRESTGSNTRIREVWASDWDAEAFLIVLSLIHGQHLSDYSVPNLEELAKIAVIVDYYDCHDAVELLAEVWIRDLQKELPSSYGKQCVLWMFISWVFLRVDILENMARLAVEGCKGPVQTMGLPLPDSLLQVIEAKSAEVKTRILKILENLKESLITKGCNMQCTDLTLGALTRQMHTAQLLPSRVQGMSVVYLQNVVSKFTSTPSNCRRAQYSVKCDLQAKIRPFQKKGQLQLENLQLEEIWSNRLRSREEKRFNAMEMMIDWWKPEA
ncbi:hypothetical protein CMQ_2031 [Grosmannia clavigera kw1407]|uniref:BTB domain-containing protein n=1 Tax=Grosmannia clavigera (strain kw1407 / UAMH 11150) TaxID=655863 RepID=F0XNB1_GROCL|nr:uncharacterized protein CMQ_2031 [Grosmannia clavigera kw1407]EFX00950.1 hypothetical protein CMQ_2031 [Grosmannia clavigera kw1407]